MNEIILSLGGITNLNGSCPSICTDEQLSAFLNDISYFKGREKITVSEVRDREKQIEIEKANRDKEARCVDALRYLASTDWYIVRQQETGKPVPADVFEKRQQARESIQ